MKPITLIFGFLLWFATTVHSQNYRIITTRPIELGFDPSTGTSTCETGSYDKYRDYVLVFSDEFNGSSLDGNKWETYYTNPQPLDRSLIQNCDWEDQIYVNQPRNIKVENGVLKLIPRYEISPYNYSGISGISDTECGGLFVQGQPFNLNFAYTSGLIRNRHPLAPNFQFGKFEFRVKMPKAKGAWPAIWLFGNPYEYDIFENFNTGKNPMKWQSTVHLHSENKKASLNHDNIADWTTGFHTFTFEFTPNQMLWSVDGSLIRKIDRFFVNSQPANCGTIITSSSITVEESIYWPTTTQHWFQLLLNVAVHDNPDLLDFNGSRAMEIDYIRVYQRNGNCTEYNKQIVGPSLICEYPSVSTGFYQFFYPGASNINWYVNPPTSGIIISNPNNPTTNITFPKTGVFFLSVGFTDHCGSQKYSNSLMVNVTTSSCGYSSSIKVYPNPHNGRFTVELPLSTTGFFINLYDTRGKLVQANKTSDKEEKVEFDIQTSKPGVYYLNVFNHETNIVEKVVYCCTSTKNGN